MWIDDLADAADPGAALAADGIVPRPQIDAALRYQFPPDVRQRTFHGVAEHDALLGRISALRARMPDEAPVTATARPSRRRGRAGDSPGTAAGGTGRESTHPRIQRDGGRPLTPCQAIRSYCGTRT
jgi:hypothetical protein